MLRLNIEKKIKDDMFALSTIKKTKLLNSINQPVDPYL